MKVLKWLGIIALVFFTMKFIVDHDEETAQPPTYSEEEVAKAYQMGPSYQPPVPGQVKPPAETVYVEIEKPASPKPEVVTYYFDPDYPDVLYTADQIHKAEWLFPTGLLLGKMRPGSAEEKEYMRLINGKKRYKPDYESQPVEISGQ